VGRAKEGSLLLLQHKREKSQAATEEGGGDGGAALGLGFGVHKLVLHQRSSTQTAKQSASDDSVSAYSDAASFACE
jgi:hypothetical protein